MNEIFYRFGMMYFVFAIGVVTIEYVFSRVKYYAIFNHSKVNNKKGVKK